MDNYAHLQGVSRWRFLTVNDAACYQGPMAGPKIVKRYANRKLYDTERSCYVTLDDISVMIRGGEDVQVIDNKSGEDLTSVTLAQIIFEAEKKRSFMPLNLLKGLIQNSGDVLSEFARDQVETVHTRAQGVQEQVTEIKGKVRSQWDDKVGRRGAEEGAGPTPVKDLYANTQRTLDDLQRGFEERFQGSVDVVTQNVSRELDDIRRRLAALKDKMRKYSVWAFRGR